MTPTSVPLFLSTSISDPESTVQPSFRPQGRLLQGHRGPWEHRKDRAKPSFSSFRNIKCATETSGEKSQRYDFPSGPPISQGKGQQEVSSHLAHPLMPQTHPASPQPYPWLGKSHLNQAPAAQPPGSREKTTSPSTAISKETNYPPIVNWK